MVKNYLPFTIFVLFQIVCTINANNEAYYMTLSERIEKLKTELHGVKLYGEIPYNFDDPDCNRTSLELITSKGYPAEQYEVETEDNYVLGVQRILAGQNQQPDGSRKPSILLQHGLGGCSVNWVANLANQSLAYILADAGYDVWLCNSRGNTYSTKHKYISPQNPLFWQFRYFQTVLYASNSTTGKQNTSMKTWDQMAEYDLPAVVNYILNTTGNSQLYYAGHSQGTMIGFAKFSSDLEFAKKIKAFFALAPVAKVGNIQAGIRKLAPYTKEIQIFLAKFGYFDFFPYNGYYHKYEYDICNDQNPDPIMCKNLFDKSGASKDKYYNQSRIPVYMSHCPAGTSTQNMAHYGQTTPPLYNVSNLNVPTIVFHSDADALADPTDVTWLLSQINGTIVENYHYTDYSHGDFILAMNAATEVYSHITDYIKNHEN